MSVKTLPSLRRRGVDNLISPTVVVDKREQTPLPLHRFRFVRETLRTGDYSFKGGEEHFSIERKTIDDLIACCAGENRERFERELHRLRGFVFARLLIVGSREDIESRKYRSQMTPVSVLGSLGAWEARYGVPIVFIPDPIAAAKQVEDWVYWFAREWVVSVNGLLKKVKA